MTVFLPRSPKDRPPSPHPPIEVVRRFAQGAASLPESALVVAHLLRGCPTCARVIRDVARVPW